MASKRRRLYQDGGDPFQPPTDEFDRIPPPVRYNQQFAAASPPPVLYSRQFAAASPLPESEPGDMEDGEELPLDPSEWGNNEEAGYRQEDGEEAMAEPGVDDEEAPALSDYWDPLAEPGDDDDETPAEPGEWEGGEVAPSEPSDIGDDEQAAAELGYWVGGEEVPAESGDYNDEIPAETADWKDDGETPGDIVAWEDGGEALPESGGWEDDEEDVSVLLETLTKCQLIDLLRYAAASDPGTLAEIRNIADRDPTNRNIFVHSLSLCTTGDSLAAAFASYGEIENCRVVMDKNTGRSKGYGFVLFRHRVSACRALSQPQRFIDNQMAVCQLASAGPSQISPNNPDKTGRKIFVGNLPWGADAHQLWDFFAQYGEIEEGPLGFDRRTGKCRGYALFVYRAVEEAQKAIEVPQKMYEGRRIHCRMAQSKSKNSPGYTNANDPLNAQSKRGGYNQPGNHGPPPGYHGSVYGGDGPPGFSDSGYGGDQHPGCDGGYDETVYGSTQSGFEGSVYDGPPPGFKRSWYNGPPHKGSGYGGAPTGFNASGYGGAPPNPSGYDGPPPGYNSSGYGPPHKGPGHGDAPPGFNTSGDGGAQPNESGYDGPPLGFNGSGNAGAPLGLNGSGHGCPPPDMMQAVQQTPMMAVETLRMGVQPPSQALPPNAMTVGAMLAGARQNLTASGFTPNMLAPVNPAFAAVLGPGGMQGMPPSAVPPTGPVQVYEMMNAGYQNAGFQGPQGFSNGGGGSYEGGGGGSYQCGEVGSYQVGGGGLYQGEGGGSFQVGGGGSYQVEGGGSFQGGGGGSYQGEVGGSFQGGGGGSHPGGWGGSHPGGWGGSHQGGWGGSFQGGGDGSFQGGRGGSHQGGWGGSFQGGGGGSFQGGEGGAYQDGPMGHGQMANPPARPMGGSQEGSKKRHHSPL